MSDFLRDLGDWFVENWHGETGYINRTWETIQVCALALAVATAIAVPLGAWLSHHRRLETSAVALVNIGRAVPSFGIIALALPITIRIARSIPDDVPIFGSGLGFFPLLIALFALALPPIFTNTYTGIREVDPGTVEAARGMGLSEGAILTKVEAPLASPIILAGIRVSAVQVVATSPLGALVAYGGLGRYIIDGFAIQDNVQIFAGALLIAVLTILTEVAFSLIAKRVVPAPIQIRLTRGSAEVALPAPP